MNLDDINDKIFDELVTDYLTGMYESQYDEDESSKNIQGETINEKNQATS